MTMMSAGTSHTSSLLAAFVCCRVIAADTPIITVDTTNNINMEVIDYLVGRKSGLY
jgi:hypothetical protein